MDFNKLKKQLNDTAKVGIEEAKRLKKEYQPQIDQATRKINEVSNNIKSKVEEKIKDFKSKNKID